MKKYKKFWNNVDPKYLLDYNEDKVKTIIKEVIGNLNSYEFILDYGCGAGRFIDYLSKAHTEKIFYGVDFSLKMVRLSKQRFINKVNIYVAQNSGKSIPFVNNSIDLVYSITVFQHIPKRQIIISILNEIHRVLNPKGIAKIQFSFKPPLLKESEGAQLHGYRMNIKQITELINNKTVIKSFKFITSEYLSQNFWFVLEFRK